MEEEKERREEATQPRVREGEFRGWAVSREEVLSGVKKFLEYVGYQLLPEDYIGFVRPDFRARRQGMKGEYELVGVVGKGMEDTLESCTRLLAMKAVLGDKADYVLALPPMNEYLLIEFFMEDKGRWFFTMKEHELTLWLHKPDDDVTWCLLGYPRDRQFDSYFALTRMSLEQYINMKLSRELLEEEEL